MQRTLISTGAPRDVGYSKKAPLDQRLRWSMDHQTNGRWGFVIYRCTYGDNDDAWKRFLEIFCNSIRQFFEVEDRQLEDIMQNLDCNVQEDVTLEGATTDEVRRRFRQWANAELQAAHTDAPEAEKALLARGVPRWAFCIHVDAASLKSVLAYDAGDFDQEAYVNFIRADPDWFRHVNVDFDSYDWSRHTVPEGQRDQLDDHEPEIEGSRLHDVGWMMMSLEGLMPCFYVELINTPHAWDYSYVRPTEGIGQV